MRRGCLPRRPAIGCHCWCTIQRTTYSTDRKLQPWTEDDVPYPLNVYGASKLAGEEAIREVGGRYLIFRTSWVYGPHGNNFLLTMLRLGRERDRLRVVDDQHGAPTTSIELADATRVDCRRSLAGRFGEIGSVGWPLPHDLFRLDDVVRFRARPFSPAPSTSARRTGSGSERHCLE